MNKKLIPLMVFGISFAFVEAVVVFYLRKLLGYNLSYSQNDFRVILNFGVIAFLAPGTPILKHSQTSSIEMLRELATIIMLMSVAYITGKNLKQRLGAFMIAFALWDIFYYVFLLLLTGWPKSLFDLDVYFLVPMPWVGPVLTPVLISGTLLIFGLKWFLQENK